MKNICLWTYFLAEILCLKRSDWCSSSDNTSMRHNSNMALSIDNVDMNDDFVINTIIHNNCDNYDKVRGHTLAPSANSSCSILCFFSNMSKKIYTEQI